MSPSRRSVLAAVAAVLALAAGQPPAGAGEHEAPTDFLRSLTERAAEKLGNAEVDRADKEAAFRELFRDAFDVPGISRFVLGKYWARAAPEQREAFMASFEKLHMRRFLPLFSDFSEEMITFGRFRQEDGDSDFYLVASTIRRPDEKPVAVVWRVRDTDGDFKVMDVIAEGVSMAISLRHEYSEVVRNYGIDGLISRLEEMSEKLAAE